MSAKKHFDRKIVFKPTDAFMRAARQPNRTRLTYEFIAEQAILYYIANGSLPTSQSGVLEGYPTEDWKAISNAIRSCHRGLPNFGYIGLANFIRSDFFEKLFSEKLGSLPEGLPKILTYELIVEQAVTFFAADETKDQMPTSDSGSLKGYPRENWRGLDRAISRLARDLPNRGYNGLEDLLYSDFSKQIFAEKLGYVPDVLKTLPRQLTYQIIAEQVVVYFMADKTKGQIPTRYSGALSDYPGDTWKKIDHAIFTPLRALPANGFKSLEDLIYSDLCKKVFKDQLGYVPDVLDVIPGQLTYQWIAKQIVTYFLADKTQGKLPSQLSRQLEHYPEKTWVGINAAISGHLCGLPDRGYGGLPGFMRSLEAREMFLKTPPMQREDGTLYDVGRAIVAAIDQRVVTRKPKI